MTLLTTYVLPVVAALLLILCLVFIIQARISRSGSSREAYGFGQQEARTNAHIGFWKAGGALLLALIVFLIWSILSAVVPAEEAPSPEATAPPATATSRPTETSTVPSTATSIPSTPTSPLPTVTATSTATATSTPSATPVPSAVVNSPNGLFLREVPGGSQELELIPDGTTLILLGEQEQANDLEWILVLTEAGNTGWVALDFVILNQ